MQDGHKLCHFLAGGVYKLDTDCVSFVRGRICKLNIDCMCHLSGVGYVSRTQIACVICQR